MPIDLTIVPSQSKRERSPSFPYLDLQSSVDFLGKLFKEVRTSEVKLVDVAVAWQMSESSGSFLRYISALGQFGLIDSLSTGDVRKIKVSGAGRRILEDDRPGVREALLSQAALQPKLIRGLFYGEEEMNEWARERPSDAIAESYLKFDLMFSPDAAKRFISVYDATVPFIGKATEKNDADKVEKIEDLAATQRDIDQGQNEETKKALVEAQKAVTASSNSNSLNEISFKSEGAGVVSISARLDLNGLNLLSKKIAALKMLLE